MPWEEGNLPEMVRPTAKPHSSLLEVHAASLRGECILTHLPASPKIVQVVEAMEALEDRPIEKITTEDGFAQLEEKKNNDDFRENDLPQALKEYFHSTVW